MMAAVSGIERRLKNIIQNPGIAFCHSRRGLAISIFREVRVDLINGREIRIGSLRDSRFNLRIVNANECLVQRYWNLDLNLVRQE